MSCPFWSPFSTLPLDLRAEVGLRDDPTTVVAIEITAAMDVCVLEPKLLKFPNFHFPAAHREISLGPERQPGSASQGL